MSLSNLPRKTLKEEMKTQYWPARSVFTLFCIVIATRCGRGILQPENVTVDLQCVKHLLWDTNTLVAYHACSRANNTAHAQYCFRPAESSSDVPLSYCCTFLTLLRQHVGARGAGERVGLYFFVQRHSGI